MSRYQCVRGEGRASESRRAGSEGSVARSICLVRSLLTSRAIGWFVLAVAVGFLIAAVQLVPLAEYLKRSQAWVERSAETRSPFEIRKPQLLAMPALVAPYVYGSYCRGHPHMEKAVGVENFNEIAGGYTGLATIALLVPLAWRARHRQRWLWFWFAIDVFALAAAYRLPVVDNLLRVIPILNVTQNQRLLLVVSLAHCLLGGAGLESWAELAAPGARRFRWWLAGILAAGAAVLVLGAVGVRLAEPQIHRRAVAHFEGQAAVRGLPADALRDRAQRQAEQVLRFFPRYYGAIAAWATALAGIVCWSGRGGGVSNLKSQISNFKFQISDFKSQISDLKFQISVRALPSLVFSLTIIDLFLFGRGYNPAIPLKQYFPACAVTDFLRARQAETGEPFRVLSLEEEFPPNVLSRYGIADLRNYDAIEVREMLRFFKLLWAENEAKLTSNSWTTWDKVHANLVRLQSANVRYLISTKQAPDSVSDVQLVHRHGPVRVYQIQSMGLIQSASSQPNEFTKGEPFSANIQTYRPGRVEATVSAGSSQRSLLLSETYMPGWKSWVDGHPCEVKAYHSFLSIEVPAGEHRVVLEYSPARFKWGASLSLLGLLGCAILLVCGSVRFAARSIRPQKAVQSDAQALYNRRPQMKNENG